MRKLDVSTYGVEEMRQQEIADVNGGFPWVPFVVGAIVGGMVYDTVKSAWKGAVSAYYEACENGLYDGIPSGR